MRVRRLGSTLLSGLCVYYVMAACSGGSGGDSGRSNGTTSGGPSSGGSPGNDASSSGAPSPVPNAMADTWYASGSRIKLRYLDATDGAKQFSGWFDATRKENCSFMKHADASTRCMPYEGIGLHLGYFSDAGCAQPLFRQDGGLPAPKYGARYEAVGVRLFAIAGKFTAAQVYTGTPASCSGALPGLSDYYSFGAEIAVTEFVAATEKTAP